MARLATLLPMACDGVGPSYTCTRLLQGMATRGLAGPLFVNRVRAPLDGVDYRSSLRGPFAALPHRLVAETALRRTERRYIAGLAEDDIAYLWPAATLSAYEAARNRGLPVVGEGINTRMAHARDLLDAVYAAEGLPPAHGITEARIREEDEKLALTTAFFAPSAGVEQSLAGAPITPENILPTSYGVVLNDTAPPPRPVPETGPRVLFVGYGGLRKGLHQLLRAWALADLGGTLVLAGRLEPVLQDLCADHLNRPDVELLGFVQDVAPLYASADIFVLPSFEEGDPLVTYEAAAQGLPIIASPAGAGRIGADTGCTVDIDPTDPETIADALRQLAGDDDARRARGARCRTAAEAYSWTKVGQRRADALARHLGL